MKAVSYTHLDVYKRQGGSLIKGEVTGEKLAQLQVSGVCSCTSKASFMVVDYFPAAREGKGMERKKERKK